MWECLASTQFVSLFWELLPFPRTKPISIVPGVMFVLRSDASQPRTIGPKLLTPCSNQYTQTLLLECFTCISWVLVHLVILNITQLGVRPMSPSFLELDYSIFFEFYYHKNHSTYRAWVLNSIWFAFYLLQGRYVISTDNMAWNIRYFQKEKMMLLERWK